MDIEKIGRQAKCDIETETIKWMRIKRNDREKNCPQNANSYKPIVNDEAMTKPSGQRKFSDKSKKAPVRKKIK